MFKSKKIPNSTKLPMEGVRDTKVKVWLETIASATTIGYRVAACIGALATFAYLRLINFFPSGLTPGEVLFFLFIALAFAITYLLTIGYGAFSTLWIVNVLTAFRNLVSLKPKDLTFEMFSMSTQHSAGMLHVREHWRNVRLRASRAKLDDAFALPKSIRGWAMGIGSFLVFLLFFSSAIELRSVPLTELLIATTLAGFVALTFASLRTGSTSSKANRARLVGLVLAPAMILFFYAGPKPFLNIVFEGLGIYVPHTAIELPESELGAIERVAEHIGRPLVDCRRPSKSMILVHGADVLWTGIGDQTVVRFSALDTEPRTLFSPDRNERKIQLKFDTKSLRIVKSQPSISPCFSFATDALFDYGKVSLNAKARRKLEAVIQAVKQRGTLRKIVVRDHSAPVEVIGKREKAMLDDKNKSKLRSNATVNAIIPLIEVKETEIVSEGVGSSDPISDCGSKKKANTFEFKECNKSNWRIDLDVEYAN